MSKRPQIIVCELPAGGQMAAAEGRTCPADQPWPGQLALSPIHELARADH